MAQSRLHEGLFYLGAALLPKKKLDALNTGGGSPGTHGKPGIWRVRRYSRQPQVFLGSQLEQGVRQTQKCLWFREDGGKAGAKGPSMWELLSRGGLTGRWGSIREREHALLVSRWA